MARKPKVPGQPPRPRGRPRREAAAAYAAAAAAAAGGAPASPAPVNVPTAERIAEVLAEYTQLDTQGRRVNQAKTTLLTNFDKEGGDKQALKALHRALSLDPAEASAKLSSLVHYQATQGITVRWQADGQGTLMDHLGEAASKPTPAAAASAEQNALDIARAKSDGYNSGIHGAAPSDNPHQHIVGSEVYVAWHNGRDEGQQDRLRRNPVLNDRISEAVTMPPAMPPSPEVQPPAA